METPDAATNGAGLPDAGVPGEKPSMTTETAAGTAAPRHPLLSIWIRPRETIRRLADSRSELPILLLACLAATGQALGRASRSSATPNLSSGTIVVLALVIGCLWGPISLWFNSHAVRWTGRWLGGQGNSARIRMALGWAALPGAVSTLLNIPEYLLFGRDILTDGSQRLDAHPVLWIPYVGFGLLELALGIESVVMAAKMVAEVQGFRTAWRGLGNLALAGVLYLIFLGLTAIPLIMLLRG